MRALSKIDLTNAKVAQRNALIAYEQFVDMMASAADAPSRASRKWWLSEAAYDQARSAVFAAYARNIICGDGQ